MASKILPFLILQLGLVTLVAGQRVHFSKIDLQPNGLYYQTNTIEPFSGMAFDVHPALGPKEREAAKKDYESFLKMAKKSEEVQFKDGKKHGKAMAFDQLGAKIFQAEFVEGKKTGLETQWYARGEKKLEVPYTNDKPDGMAIEWHKNGKKKSEGLFKMGREEGIHTWWFEDGGKDQELTYVDGVVTGKVRNWYPGGQLKLDSDFKQGVHDGPTIEYYANGKKKAEGAFAMGKEEGKMSAWASTGQILDEKIYEQGQLIKAMDYRTAGIRTKEGFTQVFNTLESNYLVKVNGERVRTVNTLNIGFIVDEKLLQLVNAPISTLEKGNLAAAEALQAYKKSELKQALKDYGQTPETVEKTMNTKNGLEALYWSFDVPEAGDGKQRRLEEEHFLAVVCGKDILLLSSVVTNLDRAEAISKLLERVADTIEVKNEPIDLNAIREKAIK